MKKEIFIYDLNRVPSGSCVLLLWKNTEEGTYQILHESTGGRRLVNKERNCDVEIRHIQGFIDRVWLEEKE